MIRRFAFCLVMSLMFAFFLKLHGGEETTKPASEAPPAEEAKPAEEPAPAPAPPVAEEAPPAEAPAAEAPPTAEKVKTTALDVVIGSGLVGWLTIGLSVIGISLILINVSELRRTKMFPTEVVSELEELLNRQQYQEAMELCEVEQNPLTMLVGAALSKINAGYGRMVENMTEVGEDLLMGLQQRVSYIALIGNIAPMMGLLGTVLGMVMSFDVIYQQITPDPRSLAHGISVALYTTVIGLIVAIPMLAAYQIIANRLNKLFLECGGIASQLLERFRGTESSS